MKKNFYRTMFRLLAGATRRVYWRWLNEWKVAMGISLIAAGHTAAGKEAATAGMGADVKAPEAIHADTLRLPDERAKEEDALLISDPEVDAKPLFLGNWRVYFQGHLSYPPEALEEGATGRVYVLGRRGDGEGVRPIHHRDGREHRQCKGGSKRVPGAGLRSGGVCFQAAAFSACQEGRASCRGGIHVARGLYACHAGEGTGTFGGFVL